MASVTYSFQDVVATIIGAGISHRFTGVGDEGITVENNEDKNTMTPSADGSGMHSLHAWNGGSITVRCLKTSPTNAVLSAAYNYQKQSSVLWGDNTITVNDTARGDTNTGLQCAFKKHGSNTYAKDGNMIEWPFDVITLIQNLSDGSPVAANVGA